MARFTFAERLFDRPWFLAPVREDEGRAELGRLALLSDDEQRPRLREIWLVREVLPADHTRGHLAGMSRSTEPSDVLG